MIEVSVCDIEPEKLQKNMKNNYHQYSDHPENTSDILVFFSFCMYMYMCVHTHTHTDTCVCLQQCEHSHYYIFWKCVVQ